MSDATPLRRPTTIVRDGCYISDRGNREPDGLQRPQRRFPTGAWTLDLNVQGTHPVLHGLSPGILGGDLRRIGSGFARTLEALAARRRPSNCIPLGIRDGDHCVVDRGVHMRCARCDVFALAPTKARRRCRRSCHDLSAAVLRPRNLFLFPGDWPRRTLSRPRVGVRTLPAHRETLAMP